mgnify:CR=1 FL=1
MRKVNIFLCTNASLYTREVAARWAAGGIVSYHNGIAVN